MCWRVHCRSFVPQQGSVVQQVDAEHGVVNVYAAPFMFQRKCGESNQFWTRKPQTYRFCVYSNSELFLFSNIRNETAREFANSATLRKLFDTIPVPTHKRSGVDSYVCVTHHSAPEDGNSSGVDLFALSPKKTPTYARPFGQRTGSSSKGSLVGSDKVGDGKDPLSADDSSSGLKSRNKTLGTSRVGKGGGASKQAPLGDFEKLPSTINENAAAVTTGSLQKSPYEFPVTQVTNQPDVKKSAVKKGGSKGKTEEKESSSSGNVKKKLTRLYSDGEDSDLDLASDAKKRDESSSRKKISNVKAQDSGKDTSSGT